MTKEQGEAAAGTPRLAEARRQAAVALARLAEVAVECADERIAAARRAAETSAPGVSRVKPGEFVADELSLVLREQPYAVRCLLARSRRMAASLPTVWEAFRRGDLDAEQIRVIDRVARRVSQAATLAAIDQEAVEAAQRRCPKQLSAWLLRLVVRFEPLEFERRHRRALSERRVTVVQGADGMGYVTGEVSAADAAAIDGMLAAAARSLGKEDPRSEQQRRSDLFADLLLGRLRLDEPEEDEPPVKTDEATRAGTEDEQTHWLEVEDIDPETGEFLGTRRQPVDAEGEPLDEPATSDSGAAPGFAPSFLRRPRRLRIGVVVPLSSLLGLTDAPGELADRSGLVPGQTLRDTIAAALEPDSRDEILFTRLLTDDGGRLLDTTELGRFPSQRLAEAVMLRAGTCRFPTCNVPADRCDIDHHDPWPRGGTSGKNNDPECRRHHRGKTHAWTASLRDDDGVDWTMPDAEVYRCVDEPLPVGLAA